jgi:hypothetical protein
MALATICKDCLGLEPSILYYTAVFEFVSDNDQALAMLRGNDGLELYRDVSGLEGMLGAVHLS